MVIIAKTAGFCKGVRRAVGRLDELAGNNVCTLGEIIHNNDMVNDFRRRGVEVIDDVSAANGRTVVIRAHGVAPKVYKELNEKGVQFVDCTCVDVKAIHKKVKDACENGYGIILAGDAKHAEVIGTNGVACDNAIIVESEADVVPGLFEKGQKYALFAQTTFEAEVFDGIAEKLKRIHPDCFVDNTICLATRVRQAEAEELSKKVDAMLVIGSNSSANTRALYEICKKNLNNTFFIENLASIDEIMLKILRSSGKIGITAGASTPPTTIKGVYDHMSDLDLTNENSMEQSFEDMLNEQTMVVRNGDTVKGKVISVNNNEVLVNLGYKSDGIIEKGQFCDDPNAEVAELVKPGDEIEAFVVRVNDGDGNVVLSRKRHIEKQGIADVEAAFLNESIIKGRVIGITKGGVNVSLNGVRAFVPASQLASRPVDDVSSFIGKEFDFNVIKFEKGKRGGVVAGRRALAGKQEAEQRAQLFERIDVGSRVEGVVRRITDFGAFIDLGGVDGLIHITQLSFARVKNVSEVLNVGDNVIAVVIAIDKAKDRISLSYKEINNNPWTNIVEKYPIHAIVSGTVVRFVEFGVFVEVEPGLDGLVHLSQITYERGKKPKDLLAVGDVIEVRVMNINEERRRLDLSIKEVLGPPDWWVEEPAAEQAVEPVVEQDAAQAAEGPVAEQAVETVEQAE